MKTYRQREPGENNHHGEHRYRPEIAHNSYSRSYKQFLTHFQHAQSISYYYNILMTDFVKSTGRAHHAPRKRIAVFVALLAFGQNIDCCLAQNLSPYLPSFLVFFPGKKLGKITFIISFITINALYHFSPHNEDVYQ